MNKYVGPDHTLGDYPKWGVVKVMDVIEVDGDAHVLLDTGHLVYPKHIRWDRIKKEWMPLLLKYEYIEIFPNSKGEYLFSGRRDATSVVSKRVYTQRGINDSFFLVQNGEYFLHYRKVEKRGERPLK